MMTVSVSQAKAHLLDLLRRTENKESILIEKKGVPVATLLPYSEYVSLNRVRNYLAMQAIFQATKDSGITAQEIYQESRRQLEGG